LSYPQMPTSVNMWIWLPCLDLECPLEYAI